jgi:hypothetical protein
VSKSKQELPKSDIPFSLDDPQIKEFLPLFQQILG